MTLPNFRPLSFGEILDGAFTLYRRNFRLFVGTSFVLMLGVALGLVVVGGTGMAMATIMPSPLNLAVILVVAVAVGAMVTMLGSTLTWQAAQSYVGRPVSLPESVSAAGGAAMTLVGAGLIAFFALFVLMMAIYMGSLLFIGILAFLDVAALTVIGAVVVVLGALAALFMVGALFVGVLPAVMVEDRGPVEAVLRSVQLAKGDLPRIAGVLFVTMLIVWLPSIAISAVTGGFEQLANPQAAAMAAQDGDAAFLEQVLSWLAAALTMPFLPAVLVLLYYDRR
ncbi:MAG TPA: hypothetical protein VF142_12705, partial [Longimicrobium sp.]